MCFLNQLIRWRGLTARGDVGRDVGASDWRRSLGLGCRVLRCIRILRRLWSCCLRCCCRRAANDRYWSRDGVLFDGRHLLRLGICFVVGRLIGRRDEGEDEEQEQEEGERGSALLSSSHPESSEEAWVSFEAGHKGFASRLASGSLRRQTLALTHTHVARKSEEAKGCSTGLANGSQTETKGVYAWGESCSLCQSCVRRSGPCFPRCSSSSSLWFMSRASRTAFCQKLRRHSTPSPPSLRLLIPSLRLDSSLSLLHSDWVTVRANGMTLWPLCAAPVTRGGSLNLSKSVIRDSVTH